MDAIDRKILAVLQDDASLSVAEIGKRVGLSSTPCWKRIQRLEADGVILKRVAVVDQDTLELDVNYIIKQFNARTSLYYLDKSFDPDVGGDSSTIGLGLQIQM